MKKFILAALMMVATMSSFAQSSKLRTGDFNNVGWDDSFIPNCITSTSKGLLSSSTAELNIKGVYLYFSETGICRLYIHDDSHYVLRIYGTQDNLLEVQEGSITKCAEPNTYCIDFDGFQPTLTLTEQGLMYEGEVIFIK